MATVVDANARARLSIEGPVARLTLVRHAQMNAFDGAMHEAVRAQLDAVEATKDLRVLVLSGEGRAFSTGQDLGERAGVFEAGGQPDLGESLETLYNPLVRRISALPIPVIAAVGGVAFGAGAALAIACDITLAAKSARFQFGFVNVGLGPDCGTSWTLSRLVGPQRAMDLALSARPINGLEAERIGLVARCVDDDQLMSEASALAARLAALSAPAVRAIKQGLRSATMSSLDAALDAERDAQRLLGQTAEYRDAVLGFVKRSRA
ncbi:enoyl-CoA hydratase-related protein [Novosphingobium piscinae]|uniref:Enoyl-CoA hydratase/isomerase family protein n=1 Tax=Novosphingobium piscinae TaxID=1507448 RepID=A0A7X1FYF0_9SPHN|nr:enoyl-CoA hydratase-related protein [Novosphingobium piscinae]MBC2669306.1 enoyl-CoA hydratase/isomerase family protein [Novosphingobium piscinae]